jgi:AbiV family abortive infection protein
MNQETKTNFDLLKEGKPKFIASARACLANGKRLLDDAEMLEFAEPPCSSLALAIIAQEEFAKGFLMCLVARDVIPWNSLIFRATRDHSCKQLLGLIMEHLNPEFDEFWKRMDERLAKHNEVMKLLDALKSIDDPHQRAEMCTRIDTINRSLERFPATVADAINILRHEKVERWKSSRWVWGEEPQYDKKAKDVSEGRLDRDKQNSLYVRLNKLGQVISSPEHMKPELAALARDRAQRFGQLLERLLSGEARDSRDCEKLESALKAMFIDLAEEAASELQDSG